MMSRQTLIALAGALVLRLLAVFVANSYLNRAEDKASAGGTTKVAVAAAPLSYGTDITPDKIRFVDFPNTSIPAGAFTDAAKLVPPGRKRVALMAIAVNEPILSGKISGEGQGASIAGLLPEGMRAASVRINDVSGVAGFVQPNDSVDVLVTRQLPGSDTNQQVSDVLLQNIRVIAIDQQAKNADGTPKVAQTATLEVNAVDAQKLALAQQVGELSLVLRKPGEQNNPVVETVSLNDLRYNMYGGARYPAPAVVGSFGSPAPSSAQVASVSTPRPTRRWTRVRSTPAKPVVTSKEIEVYRGTKSDQVKVGGYGR
jgi:pilus assembly protein CpaB